jgi:S1 RNA binding family protein
MNTHRFALAGRLLDAFRALTCDRKPLLKEVANLRARIELVTEHFWSTKSELIDTAEDRERWRERAAMLERLHDEVSDRVAGRQPLPKALPTFGLREVLCGPVTTLLEDGVYVKLDGVEWLVMIPELSWGDITHPSEIVSQGAEVEVKVLSTPADSQHPFLVLI